MIDTIVVEVILLIAIIVIFYLLADRHSKKEDRDKTLPIKQY